MSTALVTGGFGFAGTPLRGLLRDGGWTVTSVGRADRVAPEGERYLRVELTDVGAVADVLDAVRPDVVFHLAASTPQRAPRVEDMVADAVGATQALCTALRRTGCRARLVLAGSSAQYGAVPREENPVTEETPGRPVTAYGFAKAAAEAAARALAHDGAFELVPVRAFNHVGPGEPTSTVAGAFAARVRSILDGRADRMPAAGLDTVRDFTDVRDIARGYLALAEHARPGRTYHLCSGRPATVGDVLDGLLAAAGLDRTVVDVAAGDAGGIPYQVGSPARTTTETGWTAGTPLAGSLVDLLKGTHDAA